MKLEQHYMEIKIIRVGTSSNVFEYFDRWDDLEYLTEEQEELIKESATKAFKEMEEFFGNTTKGINKC